MLAVAHGIDPFLCVLFRLSGGFALVDELLDLIVHKGLLLFRGTIAGCDDGINALGAHIVEHLLKLGINAAVHLRSVGEGGELLAPVVRNGVILIHKDQIPGQAVQILELQGAG